MAAIIHDRTAAELKAELSAAIEHSRALLRESAPPAPDPDTPAGEETVDRLTGLELSFDDTSPELPQNDGNEIDVASLSDQELEAILQETAPVAPESQDLLAQVKHEIAQNPLPWAIGALVIGTVGARLLLGEDSKNPRQNASQTVESSITHGSLLGQIMKTGFEMAQPSLLEATKGLLTRIVEK